MDPELFFPVGTGARAQAEVARAQAVCARCPVRPECLSFAVVAIPEGVAGGLSAEQRRELRERRRRAVAGTAGGGVGRLGRPPVPPPGVDGLVVGRLVDGRAVVGASRDERAFAAVLLHRAGRGVGWIAARVGVHERQVYRWLERDRAGVALNPGRAHQRAAVSAGEWRGVAS